jgi:hypothetical protein
MKRVQYQIRDHVDQGPSEEEDFLNEMGTAGWRATFRKDFKPKGAIEPAFSRFWFERDVETLPSFLDQGLKELSEALGKIGDDIREATGVDDLGDTRTVGGDKFDS